MGSADLVRWLIETTLASSVAILLVLLVRRPLRSGFGAGMAYAAWALVPAMLLVLAIPAPSLPLPVSMPLSAVATMQAAVASVPQPAQQWPDWMLAAWIAGVIVMLSRMACQQHRFQRAMGGLQRRADGAWQSDASAGLPAVVGMLPSRIVLPRDFEQRYDARQRSLLLAHERVHMARGDVRWNALAMLLRSLFWFNPLLHFAHARFRHDQELACDQRVIARHPDARHAYGEAMLKTQLATQSLPLGCHWGHGHPLKERLEMLKRPVPTLKRLQAGGLLVTALVSGGAYAAWATQAPIAAGSGDVPASVGKIEVPATQDRPVIATPGATAPAVRNAAVVQPRANDWSSYEQLVGSFSASWKPAAPVDDC